MTSTGASADAAQHAGGSSFYLAMRILPQRKREAMFEVYKFCRKVDDVADSTGPRDSRIAELQRYRDDVAAHRRVEAEDDALERADDGEDRSQGGEDRSVADEG